MTNATYRSLEKAISPSRLSTYKTLSSSNNDTQVIENYIYNSKISENFYILLQNLEVSLRNSIYDSYNNVGFRNDFFYQRVVNTTLRYNREYHSYACWKMIGTVKFNMTRNGITVTDGKIISDLNFGFWTRLLSDNHYKTLIWRQIFTIVFPYYPHSGIIDEDVDVLSLKIERIRQFRNRIFHYEPIINYPILQQIHDDILEIIGWINPEMKKLSEIYDEYDYLIHKRLKIQKTLKCIDSNNSIKSRRLKKVFKNRKLSK